MTHLLGTHGRLLAMHGHFSVGAVLLFLMVFACVFAFILRPGGREPK
jgi:cbb3-type cytochrome oxidase subunit 3